MKARALQSTCVIYLCAITSIYNARMVPLISASRRCTTRELRHRA